MPSHLEKRGRHGSMAAWLPADSNVTQSESAHDTRYLPGPVYLGWAVVRVCV